MNVLVIDGSKPLDKVKEDIGNQFEKAAKNIAQLN